MVFVFVPPRRRHNVEATRQEMATMREMQSRGLEGESLERALVASGIAPERARLLVAVCSPSSVASFARAFALAVTVATMGVLFGLLAPPLRDWLKHHYPGTEWIVGAILPLLVVMGLLAGLARRRRSAGDAPDGTTRADQIDNRPIG